MVKRLLIVLFVFVLLASFVLPAAQASAISTPYTLHTGPLFNNPYVKSQQYAILDDNVAAIKNTPRGAIIHVAMWAFDYKWATNALIDAHKRGVDVRIIFDGIVLKFPNSTREYNRLKAVLGTNINARSYVKLCMGGCMSSNSMMHAKYMTISKLGLQRTIATKVVMSGSGNISYGAATLSFNEQYTLQGNDAIYNGYVKYFNDMKVDRDRTNYAMTVTTPKYKAYFAPEAWNEKVPDTVEQIFKNVRCTGAAPGYGSKGRTLVKVSIFSWSAERVNLARQLWTLNNWGCDVQVIYGSRSRMDPAVVSALLKPGSKGGGVKLYVSNTQNPGDPTGKERIFLHHKVFMINGNYLGNTRSKIVFTGSGNFDWTSLRTANEQTLKIIDDTHYGLYARNFYIIRDNYSQPITPAGVAAGTSAAATAGDDANDDN
jgi:hypothetical protein